MELDEVTSAIVKSAIAIHRELGPGLVETVYELVLAAELRRHGLEIDRQRSVTLSFNGIEIEHAFRVDLVVENRVVIEVKSLERLGHVHLKQILTYLRLMNLRVGFLLNFGAGTMKEGIKRVANDLDPLSSPRLRVNRDR